MKKLLILLFALLALSSCAKTMKKNDDVAENDILPPSKTEFRIDGELPDIGEFGKSERFYEEYTPDFIPSSEYGTIVPYVGSRKVFTESAQDAESEFSYEYLSYGFCTTDGKIVMDAPGDFNNIMLEHTDDGFEYYYLTFYNEEADYYTPAKSFVIPTDGGWQIEIPTGGWISYAGGGVICIQYPSTCIKTPDESSGKADIYDYDGKKIGNITGYDTVSNCSHGLLTVSNWSTDGSTAYYVNLDGEVVLGPYMYVEPFGLGGVAAVSDINGDSYLIDTNGVRLTTTSYTGIMKQTSDDGKIEIYSAAHTDDSTMYDILDQNGVLITTVQAEQMLNFCFPDDEIVYYYFGYEKDEQVWKKLDGTDFINAEHGVAPNQYPVEDKIFVHVDEDSKRGILMNTKCETIAVVDDFAYYIASSPDGRYIAYATGGYHAWDESYAYAVNLYDAERGELLFTLPGYGDVIFGADGKYAAVSIYKNFYASSDAADSALYNLEKREFEMENLQSISLLSLDGKTYYNICTNNSCALYDDELNTLVKKYFE